MTESSLNGLLSELCADPVSLFLYFVSDVHAERCAPYLTWIVERSDVGLSAYLEVLGKTIGLEAIFYLILLRALPWKKKILGLVVANLATHPIVYFGLPLLCEHFQWQYSTMLILAEVFAPLAEILIIRRWLRTAWVPTVIWILLANLASWWIGVIISYG